MPTKTTVKQEQMTPLPQPQEVVKIRKFDHIKIEKMVRDVLIVEDNKNSAMILSLVVEKLGYSTFTTQCAAEALEYCKHHTPKVVLMDLGLPDLDGVELTNRLKRVQRLDNVPFIAVTAHVHERVRDLAMEAGCVNFVAKPFTPAELMGVVEETMQNRPS